MIDLAKKYKTIWGVPVILHEIVGDFAFGRTETLIPGAWREDELVEISPWDHIKKGDPVRVRDNEDQQWQYRLFYKTDKDGPTTIVDNERGIHWNYCEKISVEDLP